MGAQTTPVGPGTVILVVGPSGAGKDTLIDGARRHFAGDPRIVFPRRVVTRAADAAEDHDTISVADFEAGIAASAFALHWPAHGLLYGLPASITTDVQAGRIVLFNCSRAVVPLVRERFANVLVVAVEAAVEIRAARLAGRGRESAEAIAQRLRRAVEVDLVCDRVIRNEGTPAAGISALVAIVEGALAARAHAPA